MNPTSLGLEAQGFLIRLLHYILDSGLPQAGGVSRPILHVLGRATPSHTPGVLRSISFGLGQWKMRTNVISFSSDHTGLADRSRVWLTMLTNPQTLSRSPIRIFTGAQIPPWAYIGGYGSHLLGVRGVPLEGCERNRGVHKHPGGLNRF